MEVQILLFVHGSGYALANIVISLYLKDLPSQDADVIVKAFSIHDLHHLLQKMVFIASDGASINSALKGGIAAKFREEEELSWLSFIWFLSHKQVKPAKSHST